MEVISAPFIQASPVTRNSVSDSSSSTDSDHGYVTPVENFADDEQFVEEIVRQRSPVADVKGLVIVEPELKEKIIKQVEWYFSDENLFERLFPHETHQSKQARLCESQASRITQESEGPH